MKKLIKLFLSITMILCLLPSNVLFAEDDEGSSNIICVDNEGVVIYVKYQEQTFSIKLEITTRVEDLRKVLKDKTGIDTNKQMLVFAGTVLQDGNSLQDYSIQKGNSLELYYYEESTITPDSRLPYKITSGGTYTIKGGTYYAFEEVGIDLKLNPIIEIATTDEVNLNIVGDVEVPNENQFIKFDSDSTVNINATNYSIKTNNFFRIKDEDNLNVTVNFNGGNYSGLFRGGKNTTLKINNCNFIAEKEFISAYQIEINNCNNYAEENYIDVKENGNLKFIGKCYFKSPYKIELYDNATLTVDDSFESTNNKYLVTNLSSDLGEEVKRQITKNTSEEKAELIINMFYTLKYMDGTLYYWNHTHKYDSLEVSGETLVGICTDQDCGKEEKVAQIHVFDATYTGAPCYAVYRNRIAEIEFIGFTYNTTTGEAPVDAGEYNVKGTFTYKDNTYMVSKDFKISKATPTVEVKANTLIYNGLQQELVSGTTDGGTLLYKVNDGEWAEVPTAKDAGTYKVAYKVEGDNNYEGVSEQTIEVTIEKAQDDDHSSDKKDTVIEKEESTNNKVVTCEEYMNSKDWTWSESKKACVYRVSNTSTK